MITNVIDKRNKPYRWKTVNAVIENTWQDNSCADSDQTSKTSEFQVPYDEKQNISVAQAMTWGMSQKADVTLYIYDKGDGI